MRHPQSFSLLPSGGGGICACYCCLNGTNEFRKMVPIPISSFPLLVPIRQLTKLME
jgi:hypothetical protein